MKNLKPTIKQMTKNDLQNELDRAIEKGNNKRADRIQKELDNRDRIQIK